MCRKLCGIKDTHCSEYMCLHIGEKETKKSQGSNQGGFCHHAKELGHYSEYNREVLKPETALIKYECVCVCVF